MQSMLRWAILQLLVHGKAPEKMARSPVTQADWSLAGVTIFAGLSKKALERVQQDCSWHRFPAGESIVSYLDTSDDVFFSTHREAVTREFARLSRIGLIERQRNALLIKDVERLAEMVHAATGE